MLSFYFIFCEKEREKTKEFIEREKKLLEKE